jgi:O-succinylbenzoic acid--CoA ligase
MASAVRLGVAPDDRWLCCLPPCHVGGLAPILRSTLYGTTAVLQRGFDAERTAAVIAERAITAVSLVPTQCTRLLDAGWHPPEQLRFVLLGGAAAGQSLLERCRERTVPVAPTYGLTETASQVATEPPGDTATTGTVGRPLLWTDVTIVADGERCEPGEPGEIRVAGPTVTPGYCDPDATAAAFDDAGRLRTGDIGTRDEDGRLRIVGRRDDRIVTGGENVTPAAVEGVLTEIDGVRDAAVVGLADPEWGERVAALIASDTGLDPATVREHCTEQLAAYERPKTIAVVEALPRTASGTVDRAASRERLRAEGIDL